MNEELKKIKKTYGEGMAKLCRKLFPTLIEEGILFDILTANFQENKYLSEDIIEYELEGKFEAYINSKLEEEEIQTTPVEKTPAELMSMAGYDLFECKTEEEIQAFKHYYAKGEELCTFNGGRLKSHHVFFAVKRNVDEIKRKDFLEPDRQDEYGTSVISIQFSKLNHYLSIKNRYNSIVPNPDSAFSNNLDNIAEGLTESFEQEYGFQIGKNKGDFEIPYYVRPVNGKFYRYNYEINGKYYCVDNTIIDNGEVIEYDKDKHLLIDYFLIDTENKTVSLYDKDIKEDFVNHFKDVDKIEIKNLKIDEAKKGNKEIVINKKDGSKVAIKINKYNQMISLDSDDAADIGDNFLFENNYLTEISLHSAKHIKNNFLGNNTRLSKLISPSVETIENAFLPENDELQTIDMPMVKEIGDDFLWRNSILNKINTPKLEITGNRFLLHNKALRKVNFPSMRKTGDEFLHYNYYLDEISAPLLETMGDQSLHWNLALVNFDMPSLKRIGYQSLFYTNSLKYLNLPEIEDIQRGSFGMNDRFNKMTVEEIVKQSKGYKERHQLKLNFNEKEDDERTM